MIPGSAKADRLTGPVETMLQQAREAAAELLTQAGRADLAATVLAGRGDDFPEVAGALAALRQFGRRLAHYDSALRQYAEADFWDDDMPGGALARHDRGEMARNVLNGKPAFFHRD